MTFRDAVYIDYKTDRTEITPGTIVMTFREAVFTWIAKLTELEYHLAL